MQTIKRNALYGTSIALCILTLFCGCGGMKYNIVNTKRKVSTGYQADNTIYFLCEYVLSKPGKEIIPMYIYKPGDVYVHHLFFYRYNILDESLSKVSTFELPEIDKKTPDITSTQWLKEGAILYAMFPCDWNGKQRVYEVVKFSIGDSTFQKISDNEKQAIRNKFNNTNNKNNVLSTSHVLYYVDCIPLAQWDVPSPLAYCSLSKKQLIQTFIDGMGDSYFKNEAFMQLVATCSSKELMAISVDIEKKYTMLSSYKKMEYAPYRDRWVTRFLLAAQYGPQSKGANGTLAKAIYNNNNDEAKRLIAQNGCTTRDDNGTTLLMIAAYADNVEIASLLLSKNCNINDRDNHGCTPLIYAVFGNAVHTMELLLRNNADVMIESSSKYIAWMYIDNAGMRQRYLAVDMAKHKSRK